MADGRLVTNYQNHCSQNIPTGRQFATKEWMVKNTEEIIRVGRSRFAERTGAMYGLDKTVVPPPAAVVHCSRADCALVESSTPGGIGVERAGAAAPALFGTWDPQATLGGLFAAPAAEISLTRRYEGGRNTPRGGGAGPVEMA